MVAIDVSSTSATKSSVDLVAGAWDARRRRLHNPNRQWQWLGLRPSPLSRQASNRSTPSSSAPKPTPWQKTPGRGWPARVLGHQDGGSLCPGNETDKDEPLVPENPICRCRKAPFGETLGCQTWITT